MRSLRGPATKAKDVIRMRFPLWNHQPSEYKTTLLSSSMVVVVVVVAAAAKEALVMVDVDARVGIQRGASHAHYPA